MNLLSVVLALVALPLPASADFSPCQNMPPDCKPKMLELKTLLTHFVTSGRPPLSEMHNLKEELCQETKRCFSNCDRARSEYQNACEELRTHMYGLDTDIIPRVFEKLLINKNYEMFTTDPSLKRKVFKDGKSTFLSMVPYAYFLKQDYDALMDLYTIPPVVRDKCNTPYDKFQKMQCDGLLNHFPAILRDMNNDPKFNATELSEYSKRCQDCIDNTCLMQPPKAQKWKAGKKYITF